MNFNSITKIISVVVILGAILLLYGTLTYLLFEEDISIVKYIVNVFFVLIALVQLCAGGLVFKDSKIGFGLTAILTTFQIFSFSLLSFGYKYTTLPVLELMYNISLNTIAINFRALEANYLISWEMNETNISINFIALYITLYCFQEFKNKAV